MREKEENTEFLERSVKGPTYSVILSSYYSCLPLKTKLEKDCSSFTNTLSIAERGKMLGRREYFKSSLLMVYNLHTTYAIT